MRHYTPIDTAIAPEIDPHYETGVIDVTIFHSGGGETTLPIPIRFADNLATSIHTAVLAVREFNGKRAPA